MKTIDKKRTITAPHSQADAPGLRWNESAGADKQVVVKPGLLRATIANEIVGAGKYIMIASGTSYNLSLLGMAFSASKDYRKGDVVTQASGVYVATSDIPAGTFDATKWRRVADDVITGIPTSAGEIVTTGRYHNAISVAGFLVDDDSLVIL